MSTSRIIKDIFSGYGKKELNLISSSIQRTEKRLLEFEAKYHLSTNEFLQKYENDEFEETLELDEWIGESIMLERLRKELEIYKGVDFAD
ncbi:hypothetical protein [Okeania sp. KiyG1]|uniref:hypothetical protein n=1 Tax=Okeania sp. KiyG1 TaxID=2720165 RepID=UPI001997C7DA|nr:hypothetical protein [Okeania sp. KiyG1]GGA19053.1 hypothetical protein CYANOKiyG1_33640 [Okeania sp. KiyG1]